MGALTGYTSIGNAVAAGSLVSAWIAAFSFGDVCAHTDVAHATQSRVAASLIRSKPFETLSALLSPCRLRTRQKPPRDANPPAALPRCWSRRLAAGNGQ